MFDSYKDLMGKKQQPNKEGSLLDFLLKPYRLLFKDSNEGPKIIGAEPKIEMPKEKNVKIGGVKFKPIKSSKARAGKILWKKK